MTLRQQYIAALEKRGYVIDKDVKITKYIVMVSPAVDNKVYIGRSGALRVGSTVANSRPVTNRAKQRLLAT